MFKANPLLVGALVAATATAAIAYANNPAVQARQEAMQLIGSNMKKIAPMAQGKADFDAAVAQAAFAAIAEKAAMVPDLFEAKEDDPESDAVDEIWDNWDDFVAKAGALETAARAGVGVDSLEALGAAIGPLGAACKACHSEYKL